MLQLISGKYYGESDLNESEGRGIVYSNFSYYSNIKLGIGTLKPVDSSGLVKSYVFDYTNKIPKDIQSGFAIVRTGDGEIMNQLKIFLSFGIDAYFDLDKSIVMYNCRTKKSDYLDAIIPCKFVPNTFVDNRHGDKDIVEEFRAFFAKVLDLKRSDYNIVLTCIKTYCDSLQVLNYNFELAYTMMIYCLEALAQYKHDLQPMWNEHPKSKNIDKLLADVDIYKAEEIRNELIRDEHLKLYKKYKDFIIEHINDDFFIGSEENKHPMIRKSDIDRLIYNSYDMRSKYVHNLQDVLKTLKIDTIASGETYTFANDVYLTFAGLKRLARHVIINFIDKCDSIKREKINWKGELPGIVSVEVAPHYWVWKTDGFSHLQANARLNGFLSQFSHVMFLGGSLTSLTDLMTVYEKEIPRAKKQYKVSMLTLYLIYNSVISKDQRSDKFQKLFDENQDLFDDIHIYSLLLEVIINGELSGDPSKYLSVFVSYRKKKYDSKNLNIPRYFETLIINSIRNKYICENDLKVVPELENDIICEYTGNPHFQEVLRNNFRQGNHVSNQEFVQLFKESCVELPQ